MRDFSYSYNEPLTKLYFSHPSYNEYPVVGVTWKQATAFCFWRTNNSDYYQGRPGKKDQKIDGIYRLPTEAEWEYAARGLSTTIYPWGNSDDELSNHAWFSANTDATNPAGQKRPNEFGLHDMLGNVWEWTQDCWNPNYINAPSDGSAWISNECSERVLRGGSWDNDSQGLRVAIRSGFATDFRYNVIGLRVAMTP